MNDIEYAGKGTLPPNLERRIQSGLAPGERLVWVGRPRPDQYVGQAAICMILAAVTAGAGLISLLASNPMAAGAEAWASSGCLSVALLLAGVGAMAAAPLWMSRRYRRAAYVLTDRRVIIREPDWLGQTNVYTYGGDALSRMYRVDRSGGEGDLVFEDLFSTYKDSEGGTVTRRARRGFMSVDRVCEVEELVRLTLMA